MVKLCLPISTVHVNERYYEIIGKQRWERELQLKRGSGCVGIGMRISRILQNRADDRKAQGGDEMWARQGSAGGIRVIGHPWLLRQHVASDAVR